MQLLNAPCALAWAPASGLVRSAGAMALTDNSGHLEIQDIANWNLADLGAAHKGTLAELFG
jgi:hypothetical protein